MDVNPDKLNAFMGKMVSELGGAMNASLMLLGDKLGLYKALAAKGPMNSAELAKATGTSERYVREWLAAQAASGYIEYDAASGKFSMLPEQALALADEDSPVFMGAVGDVVAAAFLDEPKVSEAFKTGKGVGWNRAQRMPVLRHRAVLPHRLQAPSGTGMAACARRRRRKAQAWRQGRRCRLRSWRVDPADGGSLSELPLLRLRLSRGIDHCGARSGKGCRPRRSRAVRRALRQDLSGRRTMIWSASSTACTTWAIPSAR